MVRFLLPMNLRRLAKFRENRCRDGGKSLDNSNEFYYINMIEPGDDYCPVLTVHRYPVPVEILGLLPELTRMCSAYCGLLHVGGNNEEYRFSAL